MALVLLGAVLWLVYGQLRFHGLTGLDDAWYLHGNPYVRHGLGVDGVLWAFGTTYPPYWHPLTWLSHMLDFTLLGDDPGAHHLVNLALHGAVTALVYANCWFWFGRSRLRSLIAALLFAVHPQHVESVAWLAERKDLLCALFVLLALLAYRRYALARSRRAYAATCLLAAAALMAKPMAVSLPLLLLLLDAWPLARFGALRAGHPDARGESPAAVLLEKLPFVLMSFGSAVVTVLPHLQRGTHTTLEALPLAQRLANACVAYFEYLRDFLLPIRLSILYPIEQHLGSGRILPAATVLALLALASVALRRRCPAFGFGYAWFLVALLPVIGIVQVGDQARADRFMYLPSAGMLLALAALVPTGADARRARERAVAAAMILALFWASLCYMQVGYWRTPERLFARAARISGFNPLAEVHAIDRQLATGETTQAIRRATQLARRSPGMASAHTALGNARLAAGELGAAEAAYLDAYRLDPMQWVVLNNLGTALLRQGRRQEGCAWLWRARALQPGSGMIDGNLRQGRCISGLPPGRGGDGAAP